MELVPSSMITRSASAVTGALPCVGSWRVSKAATSESCALLAPPPSRGKTSAFDSVGRAGRKRRDGDRDGVKRVRWGFPLTSCEAEREASDAEAEVEAIARALMNLRANYLKRRQLAACRW